MHTLSINCEKHPDLSINLTTGLTKIQYTELDEKGRAEQLQKDNRAYEQCLDEILAHFTQCDGRMVRGIEQYAD